MRNNQADPSDHARDGDAGGREQRRADHDDQAQQRGVHTHGARLVLADCEQVQPPAQKQQRQHPDREGDRQKQQVALLDRRETAEQPIGDRRELLIGVGDELDERCPGGKQRGDHHAS